MKPFSDHSPLRRLAEILFLLHAFLWLLVVYQIAKSEFTKKQHNDQTQWHYEP